MNRSDSDVFDTVVDRLYRLRRAGGSEVFQAAADRALVAIARKHYSTAGSICLCAARYAGTPAESSFPSGRQGS